MLVDTSAWIEFLRGTGSPTDLWLSAALENGALLETTGLVVQEVLQGCRDEAHAEDVLMLLTACRPIEPVYPETFDHAAALYRKCRHAGRTVRGAVDCLIAALAIEHGLQLLANDRDFQPLEKFGGLSIHRPE